MNTHHSMISSSLPHHSKSSIPPCLRFHQQPIKCFNSNMVQFGCGYSYSQLGIHQQSRSWIFLQAKKNKTVIVVGLKNSEKGVKISRKKGSVAGAIALIIGTSIGSGILALPNKTSPAGLLPSSVALTMCWGFLLIEALLLVEINVGLQRPPTKIKAEDDSLEVISIKTMAQETLGQWGGALATMTYVFLGYTSVIAYCAKSGEIIHRLTEFPESISGFSFASLFTVLISVGGTRATDQVNRWLTVSMIGLLIAIEVLAVVVFGGWSGFEFSRGDWGKIPATLPVMIFTLVYHDLAPVLCAYLDNDLPRIRASVIVGSVVPLLALLIWEGIALGLTSHSDRVSDPVELLLNVRWGGVPFMVEAFSLLAVGTSLIGTLLSFSVFLKELINNLSNIPSPKFVEDSNPSNYIRNWWEKNKSSITATTMIVAPSLIVSTAVPDAFSTATDIAGGYCMAMLYGVLPPAMAWAMNKKKRGQQTNEIAISRATPALIGVGLFACGIVMQQISQDLSFLHL